jgi:site-specific DNA recombinase
VGFEQSCAPCSTEGSLEEPPSCGHLYSLLSNPIYIGRIPHKSRSYEGEHDAIIDVETWDKVVAQLATNAGRKRGRASSKHPSLLAGLLFTAEGVPFTPSHALNHGRRYRYYVERPLLTREAEKGKSGVPQRNGSVKGVQTKGWRLPAHQIEHLVLKQLASFLRHRGALLDAIRFKQKSPDLVSAVLARTTKLACEYESGSLANQLETLSTLVRCVTIAREKVTIEIKHEGLAESLLGQEAPSVSIEKDHQPILIEVPVRFRRRGVEAKLFVLDQRQPTSGADANIVKALTRAHKWFDRIIRGEVSGIGDIARAEELDRSYVTRVLCLGFLAPQITRTILQGREVTELTLKRLLSSALKIPLLWPEQIAFISPANPRAPDS